MTMPIYTTLVADFLGKMDEMTSSFIVDNFETLSSYMAQPIVLMSTLYLVIMGYLILSGTIEVNTKAFLKTALTIGLVNVFALQWLYFNQYFVGLFLDGASAISSLGASKFIKFSQLGASGSGINGALQTVLTESVDVGVKIMGQGGYRNWMPLLIGANYIGGGTVIVSLALIEVSLIKFFLCLLLSTGPLFIAFYMLEETKSFFKAWISVMAGFSFALIYSGMSIGMAMKMMHWVVGDLHQNDQLELKLYTVVPLFFVELLCIFIFFAVIPLAKQIGGSVGGAHTGAAVGGATSLAKKASGAAKGAGKLYNKWKNK